MTHEENWNGCLLPNIQTGVKKKPLTVKIARGSRSSQRKTRTALPPDFAEGGPSRYNEVRTIWPAKVAELADAPDLGSGGETRGGSSPPFRTIRSQVSGIRIDVLRVHLQAQSAGPVELAHFGSRPSTGLRPDIETLHGAVPH